MISSQILPDTLSAGLELYTEIEMGVPVYQCLLEHVKDKVFVKKLKTFFFLPND